MPAICFLKRWSGYRSADVFEKIPGDRNLLSVQAEHRHGAHEAVGQQDQVHVEKITGGKDGRPGGEPFPEQKIRDCPRHDAGQGVGGAGRPGLPVLDEDDVGGVGFGQRSVGIENQGLIPALGFCPLAGAKIIEVVEGFVIRQGCLPGVGVGAEVNASRFPAGKASAHRASP